MRRVVIAGLALAGFDGGAAAQQAPRVPRAVLADAAVFWLSDSPEERAAAAGRLASVDVLVLHEALRRSPEYPTDVPVGRLDRVRRSPDAPDHPYMVLVPERYEPSRDWPVLVYLHGGVGRGAWTTPGAWWRNYGRVADPERIVVIPAAWNRSAWWQESQIENLAGILRDLGREYRIDRDRVHLVGVSDGGTGVYYHAFRAATPWASFLAFVGHPAVLSSPRLDIDGQMYVTNLRNRPLFVVNGGRDRLYPTSSVAPFISLFEEHGVEVLYRPKPEGGHDLAWLPEEAARIDSFLVATPRDAHPDRVEWETEDPGRGRVAWVVIDEIAALDGDADLPSRNELTVNGRTGEYLAFPHRRASGRIEAVRVGNEVEVRTDDVARFRILVSPEAFDLERPVRVRANGRVVFEGRITGRSETLLEWAARDGDRTALYVSEIEVELRPE
jgi:predicted esterase